MVEEIDGFVSKIRGVLAHETVVDVVIEHFAIQGHEVALEVELDVHGLLFPSFGGSLHHLLNTLGAEESAFAHPAAIGIVDEAAIPPGRLHTEEKVVDDAVDEGGGENLADFRVEDDEGDGSAGVVGVL